MSATHDEEPFCSTLELVDAVKIDEAAKILKCTVDSLLRDASISERLLYVAIKPHAATLAAIPSHSTPRKASYTTKAHRIVALLPTYAESLAIAGSAEIAHYQAGSESVLDWHYWRLGEPQTVGVDSVYIHRSQLPPAGVSAETANERRLRLQARCNQLKSSGERGWQKQTASEEGISTARLRKIITSGPKAPKTTFAILTELDKKRR